MLLLTIYEQIRISLEGKEGELLSSMEIKNKVISNYKTNPGSIILSDYCYNRYNKGISFNQYLFIYVDKNMYKYVGENYSYTGLVYHKPKNTNRESVVGEWDNGKLTFYPDNPTTNESTIKLSQVKKLYEEYLDMLHFEVHVLGFKATELRHLIGRLGEFFCVLHTGGTLVKETNQHGFDVLRGDRRISVKTTAQEKGFVSINKGTFDQFDDFFVVQYIDNECKVVFYGPKETIPQLRVYENRYEVSLSSLKRNIA